MKRVNFSISDVTIKQLNELKALTGCTASELIRRVVEKLWEEKVEKK